MENRKTKTFNEYINENREIESVPKELKDIKEKLVSMFRSRSYEVVIGEDFGWYTFMIPRKSISIKECIEVSKLVGKDSAIDVGDGSQIWIVTRIEV